MLHSAKELKKFSVTAIDGEVGTIKDVYFDDEKWVIRYIVVDTGGWLSGREVLLSPMSFRQAEWDERNMLVNLTREKIQNSPGIDVHKPVSRQQESALFEHYGYPYYWAGPYAWGYAVFPAIMEQKIFEDPNRVEAREKMEQVNDADRHLRSCEEVIGYAIHATDATLGHVEDFLFDEEDWSIQLMVVDPRDWWPGKHVLVSPQRIKHVAWEDKSVDVGLSRDEIESSPEYDPDNPPLSRPHDLYRDAGSRPATR